MKKERGNEGDQAACYVALTQALQFMADAKEGDAAAALVELGEEDGEHGDLAA